MAKRITKEEYTDAYDNLNSRINSTLKEKLTKLEKNILYDFLYDGEEKDVTKIKEPFIRDIFKTTDTESKQAEHHDNRFALPRILSENEEKFIKKRYNINNSLSRVALARTMLRFAKVANLRTCYGTAKQPLRLMVLGRYVRGEEMCTVQAKVTLGQQVYTLHGLNKKNRVHK